MPASNASRLIALFGGVRATADATGLDIATVSRWQHGGSRGNKGVIPTRHNGEVMRAAYKASLPAQARLFLTWTCETCGGKIKEVDVLGQSSTRARGWKRPKKEEVTKKKFDSHAHRSTRHYKTSFEP